MNTHLTHVRSGDPLHIAAATWNTFIDVARDHQARQRSIADNPLRPQTDSTRALLRNDSGTDLPRFGILGISGIVFDPAAALSEFQNRPLLTGITPAASHAGRFAIALEPIASGRIGQALLAGISPIQVNVTSTTHGFAEVLAGNATQLTSAESGSARILYIESGTGLKWAIVRLADTSAPVQRWFLLTGSALQAGHQARWNYAFTEQVGPEGGNLSGGLTGTTGSNPARNTLELAHTPDPGSGSPWYVWGVDVHGASYPAAAGPRPVGGGGSTGTHKTNLIIPGVVVEGRVWFAIPGSHDGTCI